MLDRKELKDIAGVAGDSAFFVSLFMNVDPVKNPGGEYAIWLKNELKNAPASLGSEAAGKVERDLRAIEAYVRDRKRDFKKGLALISSRERSFWREYHLSVPLGNELVVDNAPYLKPLLDAVDRYRRYAVLLVDKESARIFVMHLGELVEYGEVHTPDVPGRHKKGGWFALAQTHYDRHIEHHVLLHLKDVLRELELFLKGEDIDMLVLGGSEEAVLKSRELLPRALADRIVGVFQAGMFESNAEILARVWPLVEEFEKRAERETVEELIARSRKMERAVTGLEAVLHALQGGRVMKLVFERNFKAGGFRCEGCGALSTRPSEKCPYCGGRPASVKYIVDHAAQSMVERGGKVEVVSPDIGLERAGRIGAFLRF